MESSDIEDDEVIVLEGDGDELSEDMMHYFAPNSKETDKKDPD